MFKEQTHPVRFEEDGGHSQNLIDRSRGLVCQQRWRLRRVLLEQPVRVVDQHVRLLPGRLVPSLEGAGQLQLGPQGDRGVVQAAVPRVASHKDSAPENRNKKKNKNT